MLDNRVVSRVAVDGAGVGATAGDPTVLDRYSEFGVPQDRRRVFFIGLRDGIPLTGVFEEVCKDLIASKRPGRQ